MSGTPQTSTSSTPSTSAIPRAPQLEAFLRLARAHDFVPLSRVVMADLETPVAAFWKLKRGLGSPPNATSFLLESVEGGENWARYTLLGTDPQRLITATRDEVRVQDLASAQTEVIAIDKTSRFASLGHVLDRYVGKSTSTGLDETGSQVTLPRFYGGLVGAISYDAVRHVEDIPDRHRPAKVQPADLVFLETRQVLVWDNLKHRAQVVELIPTGPGLDDATLIARHQAAIERMDETEDRLAGPLPDLPQSPDPDPSEVYGAVDDTTFGQLVTRAREYIAAGDIIQVVLSRRFLQARRGLHPFLVYRALRAINPSPFMFYIELPDKTLVGASPELLVRRTPAHTDHPALAEVRPIAGTRHRGSTPEEDEALARELAADPKEVAEHVMLVDLGRNDLGRVARLGPPDAHGPAVSVDEVMVIERYSHVMHLVSHVSARLREDATPAETVAATFPAGTLSGAPKIRAMQIIDELEKSRRGFYGGAVGTVGVDGTVDLAIAIRTLVADDSTFAVQAGAGIVWDSSPESEASETHKKARAVLSAIDHARKTFFQPRHMRGQRRSR